MRHPRPPPAPTVIPLPCPQRGCPLKYGGTVAHGNFYPKKRKNAGVPFLKTGKFREGVPVLEGGLWGNFWEREKRRLEPIQNGKTQEGVPLLEGGLPGNFWEWKNSGRGYPFGRGFTGKIWNKENFILYLWKRIRIE